MLCKAREIDEVRGRFFGLEQAGVSFLGPIDIGLATAQLDHAIGLPRLAGQHRQPFQGLRVAGRKFDQLLKRDALLGGAAGTRGEPRAK